MLSLILFSGNKELSSSIADRAQLLVFSQKCAEKWKVERLMTAVFASLLPGKWLGLGLRGPHSLKDFLRIYLISCFRGEGAKHSDQLRDELSDVGGV
jgi:hypothetical protein